MKPCSPLPAADYVRARLDYDPEEGVFRWSHNAKAAGTPHSNGYIKITLDRRRYYAHRLAWLYVTGIDPVGQIDHKNLDKTDNSFNNLRIATRSKNMMNTLAHTDNTSGFKGVSRFKHAKSRPWIANICVDGKKIHLGYHASPEEAHAAYCAASAILHGEFANTGI